MVSLKTQITGFSFDNRPTNAADVPCMIAEELEAVRQSSAGTFVTKTTALTPCQGNSEPCYRDVSFGSISSMGLPNQSIDYYLDHLLTLQEVHLKRAFFLSLVGMSLDEMHILLKEVQNGGFNGITELNLFCPDVSGKPQIAYDFETTERILSEAFGYFDKPLGIKLPLYFDIVHFDQAAEALNRHPLKSVNCVSPIGNSIYIEDEPVVICPGDGFGGMSGQYTKPTVLVSVHAFYQRLDPSIQVTGTGGVYSGRDAFEHILCGASVVQTGTVLHQQGVGIFERISLELKAIMAQKGYEKLEDLKGKLKYLA